MPEFMIHSDPQSILSKSQAKELLKWVDGPLSKASTDLELSNFLENASQKFIIGKGQEHLSQEKFVLMVMNENALITRPLWHYGAALDEHSNNPKIGRYFPTWADISISLRTTADLSMTFRQRLNSYIEYSGPKTWLGNSNASKEAAVA